MDETYHSKRNRMNECDDEKNKRPCPTRGGGRGGHFVKSSVVTRVIMPVDSRPLPLPVRMSSFSVVDAPNRIRHTSKRIRRKLARRCKTTPRVSTPTRRAPNKSHGLSLQESGPIARFTSRRGPDQGEGTVKITSWAQLKGEKRERKERKKPKSRIHRSRPQMTAAAARRSGGRPAGRQSRACLPASV